MTGGNEVRYQWWQQVIEQWAGSFSTVFWELGYGIPLTDLVHKLGSTVREPHNDLIGILGRGGLISLTTFLWFQGIIARKTVLLKKNSQRFASYCPAIIFLISMIILTWMNALGESPFIMSFYAISYYFPAGILLRSHKIQEAASTESDPECWP